MDPLARLKSQAGFTLIEVLATALILLVGLGAVVASLTVGNNTTVTTRARDVGTNLAREIIEASRGINYNELSSATFVDQLTSRNPRLADAELGGPYALTRRGVTYTVTHRVCVVDDARDGGGNQSGGNFCPDSTAAGAVDRAPEDYKRVTVTVAWTLRQQTRAVTQTTLINNPGSASAPAIVALASTTLGSPPRQVREGETFVDFSVSASSPPHVLKWLLDGSTQSPLICSGGCGGRGPFAFRWDLGTTADGPYLVAAQAFDSYSVSGASRSMTVVVNRSRPKPPAGLAGGFNSQGVELEWLPNGERDLRGYKVFRVDLQDTSVVLSLVCDLTTVVKTHCIDEAQKPPLGPTARTLAYRVFAYDSDYDGVTLREGGSSVIVASVDNLPPFPPAGPLELTRNADGSKTLRWRKAEPVDPDSDKLAFYRIYRDGTAFQHRYGKVGASGDQMEWLDGATGGTSHDYYVTAVDEQYGESLVLGPVTG